MVPVDPKVSTITATGGGVATDSGGLVQVEFPPGSVPQDVAITITPLKTLEALPTGAPPATFAAQSFSIESNDVEPLVPVTVTMRNQLGLHAGHKLVMYYFDHAKGRWGVSGKGEVSGDGQTLVSTTNHFSDLAYG
jgi:hypothetical protein